MSTCPSFDLAPSFGPPSQSFNLPSLKTGTPTSNQGLVGRWGRPVLRLGRLEDGAQHIHCHAVNEIMYSLNRALIFNIFCSQTNDKHINSMHTYLQQHNNECMQLKVIFWHVNIMYHVLRICLANGQDTQDVVNDIADISSLITVHGLFDSESRSN